MSELQEIRRIWRFEKHEFDDAVPRIFHQATGLEFPIPPDDGNLLRGEDWEILKDVCGEDPMFFELQSTLLDVEREFRGMARRAGIYEVLEERFRACQFESEESAINSMRKAEELHDEADRQNEQSLYVVQKSLFAEEGSEAPEVSQ
jgi:DNA sulfur modification protein DndC